MPCSAKGRDWEFLHALFTIVHAGMLGMLANGHVPPHNIHQFPAHVGNSGSSGWSTCAVGVGIRNMLNSYVQSVQLFHTLQVLANIDQARAGLTIVSGGLLLLALFTTAQYRSAITNSTLVELSLGALALVGREVLRRFSERFYEGTGPVYNFKRRS